VLRLTLDQPVYKDKQTQPDHVNKVPIPSHRLKEGNRTKLILGLWATVALGAAFLACQVLEYGEAYNHMNLTIESGMYGTTFFMLTGFHGLHVTLGATMLLVITLRAP